MMLWFTTLFSIMLRSWDDWRPCLLLKCPAVFLLDNLCTLSVAKSPSKHIICITQIFLSNRIVQIESSLSRQWRSLWSPSWSIFLWMQHVTSWARLPWSVLCHQQFQSVSLLWFSFVPICPCYFSFCVCEYFKDISLSMLCSSSFWIILFV